MKAVFSVTSNGSDKFEVMTRLALISLRLTNPEIKAIIAMDSDTHRNLTARKSTLIREADDIVIIQTPEGDQIFRNRFVRTSVRSSLKGDYLHLDSDILIRGRLDDVFSSRGDIAAALNHSQESPERQVWSEDALANKTMGWRVNPSRNLNAGVILFRDTETVRDFCILWNRRLIEAYKRLGRPNDQAPFNASLEEKGIAPTVLESRFNAQFQANPSVVTGAVIWHFYGAILDKDMFPLTRYQECVDQVLKGEELNDGLVFGLIESGHPWLEKTPIDGLIVRSLLRKHSMDCWQADFLRLGPARFLPNLFLGLIRRASNSLRYRLSLIRGR
jgi:hypothetical protein